MQNKIRNISTLIASAMLSTVGTAGVAQAADSSPFAVKPLAQGYLVAQADIGNKMKDGKCGEGKCGANKKMAEKAKDGTCGANNKAAEGSCGAHKKVMEGKCGADKKTDVEAKHKDGSCGTAKS
ncbi:hypothetical protein [Burkholderia ubonensis]|uniref:HvfA family oxazolone/thioamide-modified RiPP metallophore n=1 Tax=Burkholderia ubonensis TaxID=101571 RepID=UPI0007579016|nr:hypothetical protein [Burkholderia ubonensis]KVZ45752.1 hypothetical protein WL16_22785 [Burkholderia ubonensis]